MAEGDTVAVHYAGSYDNGEVFDSSTCREPYSFKVGAAQVVVGFEQAVIGRQVGDKIKIRVPPEEGYGPFRPELVVTRTPDQVFAGVKVGDNVAFADGTPGKVVEVKPSFVLIDANHWLAGKPLNFEIDIISIT